jgi:hypothetical protein
MNKIRNADELTSAFLIFPDAYDQKSTQYNLHLNVAGFICRICRATGMQLQSPDRLAQMQNSFAADSAE